jgi:hypothetical protein
MPTIVTVGMSGAAQDVPQRHSPRGQPLGSRGHDVRLAHDLEDARPGDRITTAVVTSPASASQHHRLEMRAEIVARRHVCGDREANVRVETT